MMKSRCFPIEVNHWIELVLPMRRLCFIIIVFKIKKHDKSLLSGKYFYLQKLPTPILMLWKLLQSIMTARVTALSTVLIKIQVFSTWPMCYSPGDVCRHAMLPAQCGEEDKQEHTWRKIFSSVCPFCFPRWADRISTDSTITYVQGWTYGKMLLKCSHFSCIFQLVTSTEAQGGEKTQFITLQSKETLTKFSLILLIAHIETAKTTLLCTWEFLETNWKVSKLPVRLKGTFK